MGRVDEAMRRAAEARATATDALHVVGDAAPAGGASFEHEAPQERPKLRTVTPPAARPSEPAPPAPPARAAATSVFERLDTGLSRKTVVDDQTDPLSREQYRRLAATLHAAQAESGLKVVMVASAVAGEGKTLTATNLALTFSESYRRTVLLIDGDLRKPSLHQVFGIDGDVGLSEGLLSPDERKLPIHHVSQTLTVLPAGRANTDPMAALVSERARRMIAEARETFDWVIIDTPPIGLLSDASLLAAGADGTVLVVKAGSTPYELVQRAISALGRDRVLGVVLNRVTVDAAGLDPRYYGRYYTGRSSVSKTPATRG